MGGVFSSFTDTIKNIFYDEEAYRIVIVGLHNSGKTSMLCIILLT
jgi:GTPase SAR1 family protein